MNSQSPKLPQYLIVLFVRAMNDCWPARISQIRAVQRRLIYPALLLGLIYLSSCRQVDPAAQAESTPAIAVKLATVTSGTVNQTSEYVANLESRRSVTLLYLSLSTVKSHITSIFNKLGVDHLGDRILRAGS
jgi:hypothetical protein